MIKSLLVVTAWLETPIGIALAVAPALPVSLLLDVPLDAPGGSAVARLAGAALISLGLACWLARGDAPSRAVRGLVAALLFYNLAIVAVLVHAALGLHLSAVGLWPAVGLHMVMAVWCGACLRRRIRLAEAVG